jgi:hypothetical protein
MPSTMHCRCPRYWSPNSEALGDAGMRMEPAHSAVGDRRSHVVYNLDLRIRMEHGEAEGSNHGEREQVEDSGARRAR